MIDASTEQFQEVPAFKNDHSLKSALVMQALFFYPETLLQAMSFAMFFGSERYIFQKQQKIS